MHENSFVFFPPARLPLISFACLRPLARTSSSVLKSCGEHGHSCLVPGIIEKAHFSPVSMMLAISFFVDVLYSAEEVPSVSNLMRVFILYFIYIFFYHAWVLAFVKCFYSNYGNDHGVFLL